MFWSISFFSDLLDKMSPSTKLEDKLEGLEKFLAWKYRIGLILKENGLEKYIKNEIAEPEEAEAKDLAWTRSNQGN